MKIYLRIYGFVMKKYKVRLAWAWLAVIGASGFLLLSPQIVGWAINFGIGQKHSNNYEFLIIAALALVGASIGRSVSQYYQQYLGQVLGQNVAYDVREQIYDRIQRLSFAYHDKHQTGQIMSRATQDVEAIQQFVQLGVLRIFYFLIVLIGSSILMFISNWHLALVTIPFLLMIAASSGTFGTLLRVTWLKVQNGLARLTIVLQENIMGARVVKSFGREDLEIAKFRKEAEALFKDAYASTRLQSTSTPLMVGIWMVALATVVWFGAREIVAGTLNPGQLASFALYVTILQQPLRQLGNIINNSARAYSGGQRIFEILDTESAVKEKPDAIELGKVEGHVKFDHVSFGYNRLSPVLRDINIDAKPGEIIALLGPTDRQDDGRQSASPLLRCLRRHHHDRWSRHSRHELGLVAPIHGHGPARGLPLLWHRSRQHRLWRP